MTHDLNQASDVPRISTPQIEGHLQGSKQLKVQVLLDSTEMRVLLNHLRPFYICVVSELVLLPQSVIAENEFLECYDQYIGSLKNRLLGEERCFRRYFSSIWTSHLEDVYAMKIGSERYAIKQIQPCIQLQAHHFFYSQLDHQIHPMVLSQESITWGLQFSYPQLSQHPQTRQIQKVDHHFVNTGLFKKLTKWIRDHTIPTPFKIKDKKINSSIRLGKQCLPWINQHPQLMESKIAISSFQEACKHVD